MITQVVHLSTVFKYFINVVFAIHSFYFHYNWEGITVLFTLFIYEF